LKVVETGILTELELIAVFHPFSGQLDSASIDFLQVALNRRPVVQRNVEFHDGGVLQQLRKPFGQAVIDGNLVSDLNQTVQAFQQRGTVFIRIDEFEYDSIGWKGFTKVTEQKLGRHVDASTAIPHHFLQADFHEGVYDHLRGRFVFVPELRVVRLSVAEQKLVSEDFHVWPIDGLPAQ
jgi:hypothetical protein